MSSLEISGSRHSFSSGSSAAVLSQMNVKTKAIVKPVGKRKNNQSQYRKISNQLRLLLVFEVYELHQPIRKVCERLNINYYSAKNVLQIYTKQGRLEKLHASSHLKEPYYLPIPKA